jgi:choline dehydrogenase-like flavoprotein
LIGGTTSEFGLVTFATMLPEERHQLKLDATRRDQFGMPMLDIHIRYPDSVSQTVAATHESLRAILLRAGIRATIECPLDRLVPGSAAHYGGAARMHSSPEYGVLDAWNRVHGATNVSVVDASSFTTAVEKNPTLTAMALAARAANHIADDLKHTATPERHADAVPALR